MNANRLPSVLKAVQGLIDSLVAAVGLIILALSANLISFTHTYKNASVSVKFYWHGKTWDQGQNYLPPEFNITRPVLLIVTGIVCMLVNVPLIVWRFKRDKLRPDSQFRKSHLLITTALAFALLFTLVATIYSWLQILNGQHTDDWIWRFADGADHPIIWNDSITFDPFSWNCALYPFLYPNQGALWLSREEQGPGPATICGLCHQSISVLELVLVLPILEAAALSLQVWERKKKLNGARFRLKDGEPDAYKMDRLEGLVQGG